MGTKNIFQIGFRGSILSGNSYWYEHDLPVTYSMRSLYRNTLEQLVYEYFAERMGNVYTDSDIEICLHPWGPHPSVSLAWLWVADSDPHNKARLELSVYHETVPGFIDAYNVKTVKDIAAINPKQIWQQYESGNGRLLCIIDDITYIHFANKAGKIVVDAINDIPNMSEVQRQLTSADDYISCGRMLAKCWSSVN